MTRTCQQRLWLVAVLVVWSFLSMAHAQHAQPLGAKIVGIGAATFREFIEGIDKNSATQRDYLAWAQGFMSAVLLTRPAGVDEGLDLNPPSFGLLSQLGFLRQYCLDNQSRDFADAVVELYRTLRRQH